MINPKFDKQLIKKTGLLLICVFSLWAYALKGQPKKSPVTLTGTLKGFTNQAEIEDLSEFQYLLPPTDERLLTPDSSGHFTISMLLSSPNYFRIGRNILYLSPGDRLQVFIDRDDPRHSTFTGKGSIANNFLRFTPFPKAGSYLEAGTKAKQTAQQTIDYILAAATLRTKQVDSLKGVTAEFKRLEKARVRADLINSLEDGQISFYRPKEIRNDSIKTKKYGDEYTLLIKPLIAKYSKGFTDGSLMKIVVYRDLANDLVKQKGTPDDLQKMKDWIQATSIADSMKTTSDKKSLPEFWPLISSIKTATYREALEKDLGNLLEFGKGDIAIDFTAMDINGNKTTLSSLKGNVIYIDLWATWCAPCLEEMPSLEALKNKYMNNPGVVFLSLSIDDDIPAWQANVNKRKAGGYQWVIDRKKLNAYRVYGVPRMLLITKDFKMADMNAPLPSTRELPGIIDRLLQ